MGAYGGQGSLLMGITWTECIIGTLCVATRVYAAARYTKRIEWNLFWVVVALGTALAAQITLTVSASYGIGNNIVSLSPYEIVTSQKYCWICQLLIIHAIGLGKVAVVALLLQIQGPHTNKGGKVLLHVVWVGNIALNILQTVCILVSCVPYYKLWNMELPGNCDFLKVGPKIGYAQGTWAVLSDIILATYPIFIFKSLNIDYKKKLSLCILLGGGYIAAIAGILKTVYIEDVTKAQDHTRALMPLLASASTEQWLVIIMGSVPQLQAAVNLVRGSREKPTSYECSDATTPERQGSDPKVRNPYTLGMSTYAESTLTTPRGDSQTPILTQEINVTKDFQITYGKQKLVSETTERSLQDSQESMSSPIDAYESLEIC